ncbi:MAG: glycosyltransferase, partial [Planctomycetes bacterium]|nr:glycosyltransferase [Planctomycetota bacterium]
PAGAGRVPGAWRVAPLIQWADCERRVAAVPLPRPDVIVGSPVFALRALARRFPNVPRIYLPHARIAPVEVRDALAPRSALLGRTGFAVYRRLERWALLHSAATVRFTAGNADLLRDFYDLPARARFEIVPQAVAFPEDGTRDPGPVPRVLFVGRLVASKNVALLLDALRDAADLPWALDIVGDGPERAALEVRAAQAGLAGRVTFHGQRDDVGPFYRAASLFAFPSKLENVSLVVLEAMAHGVPPLVVRTGGAYQNAHHEIITDGRDGLVADGDAGFRATLRAALQDPARLAPLGPAARATVARGHTWTAALDRWDALLASVAPARVPAPARGAPNVWIVPVNYNGTDDTRKCLRSLDALAPRANVVLVDNASRPDPCEALRAEFPWVHVVRNDANLGWSGGNNTGIRYALARGATHVLLLNNDTTVAPDIVARLLAAFAAHPRFGVIGPVIRYMDEPAVVMTDGVTFAPPGFPGFFRRREVPERAADPPAVDGTDIVNGCCMMIRADVFARVGLIDDRFFLIHEEADFCLRAARAGFACGVLAEPLVWHKGSTSFKREGRSWQRYYDTRNLALLLRRHRRAGALSAYATYLRYAYHRYCHEREANQPAAADAVLEGLIDAAARRTGPYPKRRRWAVPLLRGLFELARRTKRKAN